MVFESYALGTFCCFSVGNRADKTWKIVNKLNYKLRNFLLLTLFAQGNASYE